MFLFSCSTPAWTASAATFLLSKDTEAFGALQSHVIESDEQTLVDVAFENNLGYNEIEAANPGIDPWYPKKETKITLPTFWLLPDTEECFANLPGPYHTIQVGSFSEPVGAAKVYQNFIGEIDPQDQAYLRVEKHNQYYTVRSGLFSDIEEAKKYRDKIKKIFPDGILFSTHIKMEKIIYPANLPPLPVLVERPEPSCIIVNLAELRLYRITWKKEGLSLDTFPVGIGKYGTETIRGRFSIMEKLTDPVWFIPPSLQHKFPEHKKTVPPGPDNPLGKYALRLSTPDYLIHGTNKPLGIGRRVSHGCIRMNPEDIKELHSMTNIDEEVVILYQPVKIGEKDGNPYIEVHEDYLKTENSPQRAISLLQKHDLLDKADLSLMFQALKEKGGIPVSLTNK